MPSGGARKDVPSINVLSIDLDPKTIYQQSANKHYDSTYTSSVPTGIKERICQ